VVGNAVTNANVHGCCDALTIDGWLGEVQVSLPANKNDCQLHLKKYTSAQSRLTTPDRAATLPTRLSPLSTMPISLGAALATTTRQLAGQSHSPESEAGWLLEYLTGHDRTGQLLHADTSLTPKQETQLAIMVARLTTGEPLAYVLGSQHFWTLELEVNPAVLIPRPDTELLVIRAAMRIGSDSSASVLDLGTGSGAIALAIACERPAARILATDQSAAALAIAQRNALKHGISNVEFIKADWFNGIPAHRFDVIVSNPPYIADDDPNLDPLVRQHEPHQALFAGADGLADLRRIVGTAAGYIAPGGWLILEHGWQQAAATHALLESAGFVGVASHADLAGHLRVTEGQWPQTR
jgi:release factor glutamine methyltransferase